jgi:hypothetical protein
VCECQLRVNRPQAGGYNIQMPVVMEASDGMRCYSGRSRSNPSFPASAVELAEVAGSGARAESDVVLVLLGE